MRTAGARTAVIAGLFGTLAAIMTLLLGVNGFLQDAAQISWSAWGSLALSSATVFLGAICLHARSLIAGPLLILASAGAFVIGGVAVAVFMALAFVGGAAATIGCIAETERLANSAAGGVMSDQPPLFGTRG